MSYYTIVLTRDERAIVLRALAAREQALSAAHVSAVETRKTWERIVEIRPDDDGAIFTA